MVFKIDFELWIGDDSARRLPAVHPRGRSAAEGPYLRRVSDAGSCVSGLAQHLLDYRDDEAGLLGHELVEQVAPAHWSTRCTVSRWAALTRAAARTTAVATASPTSTGGLPSPRTARAKAG